MENGRLSKRPAVPLQVRKNGNVYAETPRPGTKPLWATHMENGSQTRRLHIIKKESNTGSAPDVITQKRKPFLSFSRILNLIRTTLWQNLQW